MDAGVGPRRAVGSGGGDGKDFRDCPKDVVCSGSSGKITVSKDCAFVVLTVGADFAVNLNRGPLRMSPSHEHVALGAELGNH